MVKQDQEYNTPAILPEKKKTNMSWLHLSLENHYKYNVKTKQKRRDRKILHINSFLTFLSVHVETPLLCLHRGKYTLVQSTKNTPRKFGSILPTWWNRGHWAKTMPKLLRHCWRKKMAAGSGKRKRKVGQKDCSAAHQRQMDYFFTLRRKKARTVMNELQ